MGYAVGSVEEDAGSEEIPISEALWLGSTLFHNSSCRVDFAAAQCNSGITEGNNDPTQSSNQLQN